jgi:uncharacterized protein (TIGR03083 family)
VHEYETRVDALAQTWRVWASTGAELGESEWQRASRCTPWRVIDLYAHHSMFPVVLAAPVPATSGEESVTAVDVLRGFNAPDGIAHTMAQRVADLAVAESTDHDAAELVARFTTTAPRTIAALLAADPALPVKWATYVVPIVEALRIAVMEATVHVLDVQRALDRPPAIPAEALRQTARLLAELAPAVEFIESATGRASAASPLPVIR